MTWGAAVAVDPKDLPPHERDGRGAPVDDSYTEYPEADVAEQRADLGTQRDWLDEGALDDPAVPEADAVEQLREVDLDEDEYR